MSSLEGLVRKTLEWFSSILSREPKEILREALRNIYTLPIPFSTQTATLLDLGYSLYVHSIRLEGDLYTDDTTDVFCGSTSKTFYGTFEYPVEMQVPKLKILPKSWGATRTGTVYVTYEGSWITPFSVGASKIVDNVLNRLEQLETDVAKETSIGDVKTKLDNLLAKDFSTQTTLSALKTKVDSLYTDVAKEATVGTLGLQTTLSDLKTKVDSLYTDVAKEATVGTLGLQTTLNSLKTKVDSLYVDVAKEVDKATETTVATVKDFLDITKAGEFAKELYDKVSREQKYIKEPDVLIAQENTEVSGSHATYTLLKSIIILIASSVKPLISIRLAYKIAGSGTGAMKLVVNGVTEWEKTDITNTTYNYIAQTLSQEYSSLPITVEIYEKYMVSTPTILNKEAVGVGYLKSEYLYT